MTPQPIETSYAGCRFRSRLEARWAVFFDALRIAWEYEPQGYLIGAANRPYLPDFFLPTSGTWVEVKGGEDELDRGLVLGAAADLPDRRPAGTHRTQPQLLLLGPIPEPKKRHDIGWLGLHCWRDPDGGGPIHQFDYWGFDGYAERGHMQWIDISGSAPRCDDGVELWLEHVEASLTPDANVSTLGAYSAARSARFEHGERGTRW